jgi:serine/threonine protein kinase
MSPEQCLGEEVDSRSDVYSLGVVLYEMVCGVVPFASPISSAVVVQHVNQLPPSLRSRNPSIPAAVESVVLRALEKQREARPQTAGILARELTDAVNESTSASAGETEEATRIGEEERRRKRAERVRREAEARRKQAEAEERHRQKGKEAARNRLSWMLGSVHKRLWLVAGVCTLTTSLAAIFLYTRPNIYEASTRLEVFSTLSIMQKPVPQVVIEDSQSQLTDVKNLGTSPEFLRTIINQAGSPLSEQNSQLVEAATHSLTFEAIHAAGQSSQRQGNMIDISFRHLDPEVAAKFVNAVTSGLVADLNGRSSPNTTGSSQRNQASVVDYAVQPITPVGPHRLQAIIIALFSSLALSISFVLLLERHRLQVLGYDSSLGSHKIIEGPE